MVISWGIFKMRFWKPFYGIVQGLMDKDTGLLEAFDIDNEEQSLDNMLEDLGLGNGWRRLARRRCRVQPDSTKSNSTMV